MKRTLLAISCALLALTACGEDGGDKKAQRIELEPFTATGQALTAPERTWTWIDFPDTKCRDGSNSGIAVSLVPGSTELMIYLEGGGACYDSVSCLISPGNNDAFKAEKKAGIFNRNNPENPVGNWNWVYVPYCTGDTHGGAREDVELPDVPGVKHQFVGYTNMKKYLNRVVPTFPKLTNILLTGISAGGFGAGQNALLVQSAWPDVKVKLLDDSGPPLSPAIIPRCLQRKWREAWGLDKTYLAACGEACPDPDNFIQPLGLAMANTFNDRPAGLIESTRDSIISAFLGAGLNDCSGTALLNQVPGDAFAEDLLSLRDLIKEYPQFGTWFPEGTQHTWLGSNGLYSARIGDQRLVDWVARIVRGENPGHYGP